MQLFDDRTKAAVEKSLANAEGIFDAERVKEAKRAIDYYRSIPRQKDDLYMVFRALFDDADEWSDRPKTCYNLTRGFVDTLCTLYSDPVKRTWLDDVQGKRATELFSRVEGFDDIMQSVDEYTFLAGTLAVRPIWMESIKRIEFALYPSHQISHMPDPVNPRTATDLGLEWDTVERGQKTKKKHYWSAEEFFATLDDTLVVDETFEKYGNRNPYGIIPVGIFRNSRPLWGFYDEPATDLVEANLTLNSMVTDLNYTTKFQTHDQLVLKGAPDNYVPRVGPSRYIKLPKGADYDAFFLGSSADIDKAIAAMDKNLDLFFTSRRIPKSAVVGVLATGGGSSGVAIVADQAALADYRKKRINTMRPQETALIAILLTVMEFHETGKLVTFPPPTIDYQELAVPMSEDEQARWDWRITNNLATPIDYIMEGNPDLSEPEAREKYAENVKLNQELGLAGFTVEGDDGDEGDE